MEQVIQRDGGLPRLGGIQDLDEALSIMVQWQVQSAFMISMGTNFIFSINVIGKICYT